MSTPDRRGMLDRADKALSIPSAMPVAWHRALRGLPAAPVFGRLDAAYNNAGVQNVAVEAAESTREDFDRVISINLRGVWSCMKFELRQMLKQARADSDQTRS
ncbi:SDR family NAD(P)-dependent oxidoreductase [Bradyrhizobium quebecense]|uniref:SDR family oxidoreductase n=2 Tax=Bradyrhizobium quebecense TaxID=2748629 RepID=A0ABS3MMR9_9BRAD|nr:SDR family NAD(P)-dependent oxidoreductase [Bradyrhizobium quebecense]UGY00675.1 SDR family oxidoreductase [Bradyrhizobium quebecense]